jgi:isocitrate dehydrogenase (NAD+)
MTRVTLIPGDGIGPDIVAAARAVIDATGVEIEWLEAEAGEASFHAHGNPLPPDTVDAIRDTRVALKGPCATPVGLGFRSINVALRQEFDLFANVRPARAFEGVACLFPGLDLVVVRENIEGLYSSMEHWIGEGHQAAIGIGVNTWRGMEQVCRFAFEYAVAHRRRKITAVHKANILKKLSGLFLEVSREVAKEYPQIEFEDRIVDAMAMAMVRDPRQFDVIVSTNLFGDILSDLAAGLIGGLGLAPGANIGRRAAIFEAVHGTAPDIAGKDIANPCSVVLAGAMMLDHLGHPEAAVRVENAVRDVLREGKSVTRDLRPQGGVGTRAMTEALVAHVGRN